MLTDKIIAAPATAPGISGVAMIRVSGKNCISTVDKIFSGNLEKKNANEIAYGRIINPDTRKVLDEVLIGVFRNPYSFTGEDSLEIWTHGSPFIVKELMNLLKTIGVFSAEPGEFSMRAFLNGKIDLTQAEAIRDLTHAQTKFAHAQALGRLEGGLSSKIDELHRKTLDLLALLEVAIDHAEDETDVNPKFHGIAEELIQQCDCLLSGAEIGKMSVDGVKVVLTGRPNVGKSSLLNALVDEDRVIVSDVAGTTRDVIEHRISARGLMIRFFDTAGLRDTDDPIEKEGTERSIRTVQQADIVLHIVDQSLELQAEDNEIIEKLTTFGKPVKTILNKADLPSKVDLEGISVSALSGKGIDEILDYIFAFYTSGGVDPENDILVANIRQEGLLRDARDSFEDASRCISLGESEEFTALHIRKARASLEEIVGKTTDDAILDRIFSQFCIGK